MPRNLQTAPNVSVESLALALNLGLLLGGDIAQAQTPVTGAADAEALFTSPDPKLNRNKQAACHIMKDLLEANHWEPPRATSSWCQLLANAKEPNDPTKTYTSTWFDRWRFVDGKADEHWNGATKQ